MDTNVETASSETQSLKNLLSIAVKSQKSDRKELQRLVCALTDRMKTAGEPPEKVVVAVKEAVRGDKAIRPTAGDTSFTEEVIRDAVHWCIDRYYGDAA